MTTPSLTVCEPGAVVLVNFRFTAGERLKRRPAVILSGEEYHRSRADTIMLALSTRRSPLYYGDYDLADWRAAGLPQPTKAKGVIQTSDRNVVTSRLGTLRDTDFQQVKTCVRGILDL